MAVLIDDLRHDIEASRRGVDAEQDALGETQHEHEAEQVKPRVEHHLARAGDGDGKERLLHGEKPLQEIDHRTYDERGVNGLGPKLIAQQDEGQDEQHDVDQQQVGTYRNNRKQLIDHQGQS